MSNLFAAPSKKSIPVWFATTETWNSLQGDLPKEAVAFAKANGFTPSPGRHLICPSPSGAIAGVLFGVDEFDKARRDDMAPGRLATLLPPGDYHFANAPGSSAQSSELAALSWGLSSYRFGRYGKNGQPFARLVPPARVDALGLARTVGAINTARDLINTPTNDMGPSALEAAARQIATRHKAKVQVIKGDALLQNNFPLIHAVGRASDDAPRLVDISWGPVKAPKVTLVGKGVCFDTGGLDLKPSSAMLLMKKDMAGAATALALAEMIMGAGLNVRLRVLLPIVENSVSSNAFRPGDVYKSRKGLTVEIGNTDAEGRLVLCDALALACEEKPQLLFDFATLTGAARVALGPDLPPFYSNDDALAEAITTTAFAEQDPVWRLPLWDAYDSMLDSKIASLNNVSSGPFAGSITAALYLRRFVETGVSWAHFDIYGWTPATKPGRPEGGEPQTARMLFTLLNDRFGGKPRKS
ncbi:MULTISPECIES: leucyl aminopeptidase family protein [unclassified Beijerinckia]|uniref:leucyl aminopeptidase family protein n=1 Tax=unclassified Beijerinckia TaxID=2638183 RepID=UPI0008972A9E|nr:MULTISPECIES: leucyl aminopeptidase family protein [unclassified Beijerinckia]MDH7796831.1 leucyl aminopeptidase [Beijerinckia sp. GAS462]SEC61610.1 leucyl aminopeptidase [Beijerinckia sp. 28-YEA-48]